MAEDGSIINAGLDGHFENTIFTDERFNLTCVRLIRPFIESYVFANGYRGINIVDSGAGTADLLFALIKSMEADGFVYNDLKFLAFDVDAKKLELGEESRRSQGLSINNPDDWMTRVKSIMHFREIDIDHQKKTALIQRSVSQYMVSGANVDYDPRDPSTQPPSGFTIEQEQLYSRYLADLADDSMMIMIDSTGDEIGLRRFEYLLTKLTEDSSKPGEYKRLHYLTKGAVEAIVDKVNSNSTKQLVLVNSVGEVTSFGMRNIESLYARYGQGMVKEDFVSLVRTSYSEAIDLYPGETETIIEADDDLIIDIRYMINIFRIMK